MTSPSTLAAVDSAVLLEPMPDDDALPERAVLVIAEEGAQTADRRGARPGSLSWREPPLSLTTSHGDVRDLVGRIDRFDRADDVAGLLPSNYAERAGEEGRFVVGLATFDLETEQGQRAARQVRDLFLRGVSMEVGDEAVEIEWEQGCDPAAEQCQGVEWLTSAEIGAVSLVTFPAFASGEAVVDEAPAVEVLAPEPTDPEGLMLPAALVAALTIPPVDWYQDPGLEQPTGIHVEDDGRVYGHLAIWGVEHVGLKGRYAMPSASDYAYFRTGHRLTSEGLVPCGVVTMQTGHENDLYATLSQAVSHYDDTGTQVATVNIGEDRFGIWVAGALMSDVSPEELERFRASGRLSGDWRPMGRDLELCAALVVNTPGFPIPATRLAVNAAGEVLALVAAPGPCPFATEEQVHEGVCFMAELANPEDWPGVEDPHVTLLYLGKRDDAGMPTEEAAVAALLSLNLASPPETAVAGFELFGPDDDRVLVATLAPVDGLAALREQLLAAGLENGSEFTDFRPHLTLGPADGTEPPEDRIGEPVLLAGVSLSYGDSMSARDFEELPPVETVDEPVEVMAAAPAEPLTLEGLAEKLDSADERVGLLESRVEELEAVLATLGLPEQAVEAMVSALACSTGPVRPHSTPTTAIAWDAAAAEDRLTAAQGSDYSRRAYAWLDLAADPALHSSWAFLHHEVSGGGSPGAANVAACQAGIAYLNGPRATTTVPAADLQGVYDHLAQHLRDAGTDPAPATFALRTPRP